jgi:penicillin-binding protein 1B
MRPIFWIRRQSKTRLAILGLVSLTLAGPLAITGEALVRARLTVATLQHPGRLYARPTMLYPGVSVSRERITRQLERIGYRRARRSQVREGEFYLGSRSLIIGRRAFRYANRLEPALVAQLRFGYGGRVSSVRDQRRQQLRSLMLEPEPLPISASGRRSDRVPITLDEVPRPLIDAVLSIEDQRFFEHGGLDLKRVAGAMVANLRAGRVVQGASTLTQQLVKNLFLSPRRTPLRKFREGVMSLVLEARHTKDEILEAYLNHVYLGQDGAVAIHGVGRASQFYFGIDVTRLELAQAALLAGILKGPSFYSPTRHPERATERRNLVLQSMRARKVIDADAYRRASAAPLRVVGKTKTTRSGRYFVDYVVDQLVEQHGHDPLKRGLTVYTTLDLDLQLVAEQSVSRGLTGLERAYPQLDNDPTPLQAALVALDPRSGEILAMVGGRDYGTTQFNRAVNARRQPGSAFKPVVALTALTQSGEYTLATVLHDEPLSVKTPAGTWTPVNYDGRFRGDVTIRDALERSLNVPFARLGLAVGAAQIVETARKLGIQGPLNAVPSLALGSSEVSPLELTRAFGVFAAEGFRSELHTTLQVLGSNGQELSRFEYAGERVFDPAEAYLVTSALEGAVARGTGRGLQRFGYHGPVAAKSGTTNDFRDAWFIAYTPTLAVGAWVGYDDGRSVGLPGAAAALPIVAQFLVGAFGTSGDIDFPIPRGIDVVEVNRETGLRAGPGCRGQPEVFLRGTAPEDSCAPHWAFDWGDRRGRSRIRRELADMVEALLRRLDRRRN